VQYRKKANLIGYEGRHTIVETI